MKNLKNLYYKDLKDSSWKRGEYVLTIDYYSGNNLINLIIGENGQFYLRPFHKILFSEKEPSLEVINNLSIYKKQRNTYKIK